MSTSKMKDLAQPSVKLNAGSNQGSAAFTALQDVWDIMCSVRKTFIQISPETILVSTLLVYHLDCTITVSLKP